MLKILLPLVLLLVGTGAGIGAALVLAPPGADDHAPEENADHAPTGGGGDSHVEPPDETHSSSQIPVSAPDSEFFKMTGQFVVPLVKDDRVTSMIVLSLSLETGPNLKERMHAREPKLRDLFLRVLFDHASIQLTSQTRLAAKRDQVLFKPAGRHPPAPDHLTGDQPVEGDPAAKTAPKACHRGLLAGHHLRQLEVEVAARAPHPDLPQHIPTDALCTDRIRQCRMSAPDLTIELGQGPAQPHLLGQKIRDDAVFLEVLRRCDLAQILQP